MSGKKSHKTVTLAPLSTNEDAQATLKALVLRREGYSYEAIAEELEVSPWQARQLASFAYARLSSEQADELRAQVEDRLDDVTRRLYSDLKIATNQTTRNGIYGLILKTESQRQRLLGLDIPMGTPDAPAEGDDRA